MNHYKSYKLWHLAVSDPHWRVFVTSVFAQAVARDVGVWFTFPPEQVSVLRPIAYEIGLWLTPLAAGTSLSTIRQRLSETDWNETWWIGDDSLAPGWADGLAQSGMFSALIRSCRISSTNYEFPVSPEGWQRYIIGETVVLGPHLRILVPPLAASRDSLRPLPHCSGAN